MASSICQSTKSVLLKFSMENPQEQIFTIWLSELYEAPFISDYFFPFLLLKSGHSVPCCQIDDMKRRCLIPILNIWSFSLSLHPCGMTWVWQEHEAHLHLPPITFTQLWACMHKCSHSWKVQTFSIDIWVRKKWLRERGQYFLLSPTYCL